MRVPSAALAVGVAGVAGAAGAAAGAAVAVRPAGAGLAGAGACAFGAGLLGVVVAVPADCAHAAAKIEREKPAMAAPERVIARERAVNMELRASKREV
jgi:hypothetical protein